ncbi:MAG TPA: glycosyltransferase family 1 protein [Longimicrobium sp.]|uniref:glycosyltransferase family 4 protein n=1 Tax=Longimicrobium sp. TaxID=2029185 RepID=UPI002EDA957F
MSARVGIVYDYAAENWPSMDLVGDLLMDGLRRHAPRFAPERIQPRMPRLLGGWAGGAGYNADRLIGRHVAYPRWLRRHGGGRDLYHVVDHSYAQLVRALPARRTIVTCHDLDAFRSLLQPERDPRPLWFRAMMKRVLGGLQRAAHVVCDSEAVRAELLEHGVVPADRVSTVPLAAHPDFRADPDPTADAHVATLLGPAPPDAVDLLHVGSTAPRKRIGLLLRAAAPMLAANPRARLIRVGGPLEPVHRQLAEELGIAGRIVEVPWVPRPLLAALYRRAALVVSTSEREGFGLPLVEAMACGAPVLASALPVYREVGGGAARYVDGDDPATWSAALSGTLASLADAGERSAATAASLDRARRYGLDRFAAGIAAVYDRVLAEAA